MNLTPVVSIKFNKLPTRPNKIQSRVRRHFYKWKVLFIEYEISYDYGKTWTGIGTSPEYYSKDWE